MIPVTPATGGAVGLRDEKKLEMRRSILETAVSLFRVNGFDATRVRDIASRLRISEATFFNYFATKHAVLEAAADELFDQAIDRLEEAVHTDAPVPERLEGLIDLFAADFERDPELAGLVGDHTMVFAGGTDRLTRAHGLLTELFASGMARGEIRSDLEPSQLAELNMAMILATIHAWVGAGDDDDGRPLGERLRAATRVLLHGCAGATSRVM